MKPSSTSTSSSSSSSGNHLETMTLRPNKRMLSSKYHVGRDRLSELPDEVIVHILSFMPTLDAVGTVLLRRFSNLWTLVHTFKFDISALRQKMLLDGREINIVGDWLNLVARIVIKLHKRPYIEKIDLSANGESYDVNIKDDDDISLWLKFAVDKQAKELKLRDAADFMCEMCIIPPNFTSQSLVKLEFWGCWIDPMFQVNLGSLKKVSLKYVRMCEEAYQQFLSGCPSLRELEIVEPIYIDVLSFSAPNIDKLSLRLEDEFRGWGEELRLLNFPNLKRLDLELEGKIPTVIDVSSVRDVYIKIIPSNMVDNDEVTSFKMLLGKLEGSEIFKLSRNASEAFLHTIDDDLHLLQPRWKRVVLELPRTRVLCESCLLGIYQLLKSLKHLEELVIYTQLTGAEELTFLKRVSSFQRASTSARVLFA